MQICNVFLDFSAYVCNVFLIFLMWTVTFFRKRFETLYRSIKRSLLCIDLCMLKSLLLQWSWIHRIRIKKRKASELTEKLWCLCCVLKTISAYSTHVFTRDEYADSIVFRTFKVHSFCSWTQYLFKHQQILNICHAVFVQIRCSWFSGRWHS